MPAVETGSQKQHTGEATIEKTVAPPTSIRQFKRWVGAALFVLLAGLGGWWLWQRANAAWAREQIPKIEELSNAGKYFAAFDLASEVQEYLPHDPTIVALMPTLSNTLSVNTEPAGAKVYLRRYDPDASGSYPERRAIGTTPITDLRIPRGPQVLYIEKDGFTSVEKSVLSPIVGMGTLRISSPPVQIDQKLIESASMPEKMVFVPGGDYRLV